MSAQVPGAPAQGQQGGKGMSGRTKALLGGAITVVVLAVVIFGLWAATSPKRSTISEPAVQSSAVQSDAAYQQGLAALAAKDTTSAVGWFQRAVSLNPNNDAAKKKLAETKAAQYASHQSSTGGSGSGGSSSSRSSTGTSVAATKTVDPFTKPVKKLTALLPKAVAGYSLGPSQVLGPDATRSGSPTDTASPVARVIWTVHDRTSASKAKTFTDKVSKSLYAKDASAVTVNGVAAYFGTDGARFATVSYVRGRFAFEVVLTISTGAPADLKTDAVKMAEAFPTKP